VTIHEIASEGHVDFIAMEYDSAAPSITSPRGDIDRDRLAFYGFSLGARYGPVLLALEPRLKVSVLLAGGFSPEGIAPEVDPFNFAPRANQPVLMLNGREDFMRPVQTSQQPMFKLLGAPDKDKRHVLYDDGCG
jgi:dienelactone hydrolase